MKMMIKKTQIINKKQIVSNMHIFEIRHGSQKWLRSKGID